MSFRNLWLAAVVSALALPAAVGAQSYGGDTRGPSASQSQDDAAESAAAGGSGTDTARFNTMDLDEDGFITREEAKGTELERQFDRLDTDHDGKLSPSEVNAGSAGADSSTAGGSRTSPGGGMGY